MSSPAQLSPAQREEVLEEMNRILADSGFNRSKRCVMLFTHLVNCALRGDRSEFKERTLGIEVFGRDPSYDSQADPIVRMTANEIRKRLAQYYYGAQRPAHNVKIHLDRGTYFPEFHFAGSDNFEADETETPEDTSVPLVVLPTETLELEATNTFARFPLERKWLLWIGAGILAIAAGSDFYYYVYAPSGQHLSWKPLLQFDQPFLWIGIVILAIAAGAASLFTIRGRSRQYLFWKPLLQFDHPLVVCLADTPFPMGTSAEDRAQAIAVTTTPGKSTLASASPDSIPTAPFLDASTAIRIANWLGIHGRKILLHRASIITLRMFRQGPAVLIGGFNNPWSLTLLSRLRYRLHFDPVTQEKWIEDTQNPSIRDWKIKARSRYSDSFVDYALISRYWDRDTENWIVAVSSLALHGLHAASDLITNRSHERTLPSIVNSNANVQIVLKTSVMNGTAGPPQIVSTHTW